MKTTLLFLFATFAFTTLCHAQVSLGQIDNFEDGTTQSWTEGLSSPNPPTNKSTGGPAGANDNYLQNIASGTMSGSKMIMFNDDQWTGNYTSEGVVAIKFDAKALSSNLNLRIALDGTGGRICTTNAVLVATASGWTNVTIPINTSDFTLVGGTSISATLSNCSQMRILSNTFPSFNGEDINATLEIDNITASGTLGIDELSMNGFSIIPNPAESSIELQYPSSLTKANLIILDAIGKEIYTSTNILNSKIDVSNWSNGLYLIKVSSLEKTITKRFIKK